MIGIICFNSMRYYQFVYKYTKILEKNNIEYELIFWNRENEIINVPQNWIHFDYYINTFQPFYKKIWGFLKYRKFLIRKLKEKKYNKLIVLTSQTAISIYNYLIKKYSNNYIFDYRDITFEKNYFYRKMMCNVIKKSIFTAISSNGFIEKLGMSDKYVISHNTRDFELINNIENKHDKVEIVFWGMVRQLEFNYKICQLFGNDYRFNLTYHGSGYHEELRKYISEKNFENIFVTGKYELSQLKKFALNTDIIFNIYDNDIRQKPAMTVKFYDSIMYGIPMVVNKNSYMSKLVTEYNLGFVIDINKKGCLEKLYNDYMNFDYSLYNSGRKKIFKKIKDDDYNFEKQLIKTLKMEE